MCFTNILTVFCNVSAAPVSLYVNTLFVIVIAASIPTSKKHVGIEAAMTYNVFTYNKKGYADTIQNTFEMLVNHIGTLNGQYIANEIGNHTVVTIAKSKHSRAVLVAHASKETLRTEN